MASSSSCGWCLTVPSLYRIGNHAEAEEHRQWHEEPAAGTRGGGGGAVGLSVPPPRRPRLPAPPRGCAKSFLFKTLCACADLPSVLLLSCAVVR